MAALTTDRATERREVSILRLPVAANKKIFAGSLVMLAAGYATPGATATGQVAAGRADDQVDNTGGSAGDEFVDVRPGCFKWANSADTDEITQAEVGTTCYIVDDQTVAKTNGTNTRSAAGTVIAVDADGVWVKTGL
jgi:hypothetical protein